MTGSIIFVGGPSGTGKSTIASELAKVINCLFLEGDQYHPQANIEKMSEGIPLTDEDRWSWLNTLCLEAVKKIGQKEYLIVSCSMLKKKYREYMREVIGDRARVLMIVLYNDYDTIYNRMLKRSSHFMKADMLKSQFDDLELPDDSESKVGTYRIFCGSKTTDEIVKEVVKSCHN
ncbi:DEKNAAC104875 [Brettanomyces naardenensis]|uniref:Gluconokinase n=1 Tax=Brettanomyces naardenensis TaxID=13370 RepID=A0A448YS73_BRENA|nr:DEKNAAC104875 [Brettanomyces naardenensis]